MIFLLAALWRSVPPGCLGWGQDRGQRGQPALAAIGATRVPAPARLLRPRLAPARFSSSRAAETGFNCRVASGHHFLVCKVSLVTLTHGISDGQGDVPEERISPH